MNQLRRIEDPVAIDAVIELLFSAVRNHQPTLMGSTTKIPSMTSLGIVHVVQEKMMEYGQIMGIKWGQL